MGIVEATIQMLERLPELLEALIDFKRFFRIVNMRHAIARFEDTQPGGLFLYPALAEGGLKRHPGRFDWLKPIVQRDGLNGFPRKIESELKILDAACTVNIVNGLKFECLIKTTE
jgi:hypothetical protein